LDRFEKKQIYNLSKFIKARIRNKNFWKFIKEEEREKEPYPNLLYLSKQYCFCTIVFLVFKKVLLLQLKLIQQHKWRKNLKVMSKILLLLKSCLLNSLLLPIGRNWSLSLSLSLSLSPHFILFYEFIIYSFFPWITWFLCSSDFFRFFFLLSNILIFDY